jgi:hypothetical protein
MSSLRHSGGASPTARPIRSSCRRSMSWATWRIPLAWSTPRPPSTNGQPRTYTLRATQVYRREDGEWKVAHRHGDTVAD